MRYQALTIDCSSFDTRLLQKALCYHNKCHCMVQAVSLVSIISASTSLLDLLQVYKSIGQGQLTMLVWVSL